MWFEKDVDGHLQRLTSGRELSLAAYESSCLNMSCYVGVGKSFEGRFNVQAQAKVRSVAAGLTDGGLLVAPPHCSQLLLPATHRAGRSVRHSRPRVVCGRAPFAGMCCQACHWSERSSHGG